MLPYWVLYTVFAAGALGNSQPYKMLQRISPLWLAAGLFTTLMIGLRFEVGGDWEPYRIIFENTSFSFGAALGQGEMGFMALNWLTKVAGLDVWFVNLCCALMLVAGLAIFARREPNPWLTMLIAAPYLMIVIGMGYTRQAAAIGLLLIAIVSFLDGRYLRTALLIVVAATFHRSVIIVVPLIGLSVVRHRVLIWAGAAVIALLLFNYLISQILETFQENYLESAMASEGAGVRVAMNIVPAILFLAFSRRFTASDQERMLWRNFAIAALAAVAAYFVLRSSTVVDRLALYLIPLQLTALARLPYAFPKAGRANAQLVFAVIIYTSAIQFVWLNFASHAEYWLPYRNYLTG